MNIGITGSDGLLGWHQRAYFKARNDGYAIRLANRQTFADSGKLAEFVHGLDAIFHFAGMNRGDDAEIEKTNIAVAKQLAEACEIAKAKPFIVYANSVHEDKDNAYGRGKRKAADILKAQAGGHFANVVLPHVFGEFGKPFYNSVVSTFCHQLAKGETPNVIQDGKLELVHTQEVAAFFHTIASERRSGDIRMQGTAISVSELLERLTAMHKSYLSGIMPKLDSLFDIRLFNTLRSYLFPGHYPAPLQLRSDARGSLFEAIKSQSGGQVFLSTTHPGITRGNHFHTRKVERFLVVSGEATIRLRKLFSKDVSTFNVSGEKPAYIDIPSFHTHDITNTGKAELLTLFWANEIFDPADPDTISEPVDL